MRNDPAGFSITLCFTMAMALTRTTEHPHPVSEKKSQKQESQPYAAPRAKTIEQATSQPPTPSTPSKQPHNEAPAISTRQKPASAGDGKDDEPEPAAQKDDVSPPTQPGRQSQTAQPASAKGLSNDDGRKGLRSNVSNIKREGRRSSWMSSFSSKFSSSNPPSPARTPSVDGQPPSNAGVVSPLSSPKVELTNPFNKKEGTKDGPKETKKEDNKSIPVIYTHTPSRRPSVLVAAGKETKLDHPGFLSNALRRLSSSTSTNMGKGAGSGALCPRKVMNVDQNRVRVQIGDLDQNKLRRVAFCVDVEVAGFAAQADEEPERFNRPPVSSAQKQSLTTEKQLGGKDSKDARSKDVGEGAALKNPTAPTERNEELEQNQAEPTTQAPEAKEDEKPVLDQAARPSEPQPVPTTRKKEKKKRSEAERKERRERKRRHAEANGLVPLELTREDDDSDSSPSSTPPGASTPRRPVDGPTTDPLRIYKRCCQLRETTVLSRMKEQILKPSATLAEAPGTVAVLDLSGLQMQLHDVVTLGDWLAVVPVRKLILDNCGLTDEGVRVILSGLSGCKSAEQSRQNRKLPKKSSGKRGVEQMGIIEKLSLKENPGITNLGWKHIALFMHMSRSLRAIDLSGVKFPKTGDLSRSPSTNGLTSNSATNNAAQRPTDLGTLVIHALSERLGDKLEELILSDCSLSTGNVRDIVDCAIQRKIRRLGLADNNLNEEAVTHVVRYIASGSCEGLDLGNNDLRGIGHVLAAAADEQCPLFALSLSGCNLKPSDLNSILLPFTRLRNFKFIDLSRNKALFEGESNAIPILRKLLPKLKPLKRINLSDAGMTPEQVIALAEILPDCPALAHVSILDNGPLLHAMNSKEESAQEEACALFASLMTAVRVSETISAVEIEIPGGDSSEVVKALASQVVAYSLRNMERTTLDEVGVKTTNLTEKDAPEVLLHLVGHMEGYSETLDTDEPAPDEDYMIASTGIVKALGVCLGSKDGASRSHSRNISPAVSGTSTPRQGGHGQHGFSKPRDVSLQLCDSARKIRMRLRPVLVKEDRADNDTNYRKSARVVSAQHMLMCGNRAPVSS